MNKSLKEFVDQSDIIEDMIEIDFSSLLENIKIPFLVVASRDDEFFNVKVTEEMAKKIPQGHFQKLKGT